MRQHRTLRDVAPPGTCPDGVGRTALPVFGNRDWQTRATVSDFLTVVFSHGAGPVRKGRVMLPEDGRGASYNNVALDKATVASFPIQIDDARFRLRYHTWEKTTVRTALTVATCLVEVSSERQIKD